MRFLRSTILRGVGGCHSSYPFLFFVGQDFGWCEYTLVFYLHCLIVHFYALSFHAPHFPVFLLFFYRADVLPLRFYPIVGKIHLHDPFTQLLLYYHLTLRYFSACPSNSEFTCSNGECILKARFCDGLRDCTDGSDEPHGCQGRCNKHEYSCNNGRCITKGMKCNGIDDCGDSSDETHCRNRIFKKPIS